MNKPLTASQQITEEVTSWPDVKAGEGKRGELTFKVDRREIGHLHGNRAAHFIFPKELGTDLKKQGVVEPHPIKPDSPKLASRKIKTESDVLDVIKLMRLNYNYIMSNYGSPQKAG